MGTEIFPKGTCINCEAAIAKDTSLGAWFHDGRNGSIEDMLCNPAQDWGTTNQAIPNPAGN